MFSQFVFFLFRMPCDFLYVLCIFHSSSRVWSIYDGVSLQCYDVGVSAVLCQFQLGQINSLKRARKKSWQVYFLMNTGLHVSFSFYIFTEQTVSDVN